MSTDRSFSDQGTDWGWTQMPVPPEQCDWFRVNNASAVVRCVQPRGHDGEHSVVVKVTLKKRELGT